MDPMQSFETINITDTKKRDFEPSLKTISRIMQTIMDDGPKGRTSLSFDTHLNYTRLAKHIVWLEQKGFVESIKNNSKINVGLTTKGRVFVSMLSSS